MFSRYCFFYNYNICIHNYIASSEATATVTAHFQESKSSTVFERLLNALWKETIIIIQFWQVIRHSWDQCYCKYTLIIFQRVSKKFSKLETVSFLNDPRCLPFPVIILYVKHVSIIFFLISFLLSCLCSVASFHHCNVISLPIARSYFYFLFYSVNTSSFSFSMSSLSQHVLFYHSRIHICLILSIIVSVYLKF